MPIIQSHLSKLQIISHSSPALYPQWPPLHLRGPFLCHGPQGPAWCDAVGLSITPITFLPPFLYPSYTDLLSALFYPQAFANGISFPWSTLPKRSSSLTPSSGFSLSNSSIHFLHSASALCDYLIYLCNYFLLPVPHTRMLVPLLTPEGVPGMY